MLSYRIYLVDDLQVVELPNAEGIFEETTWGQVLPGDDTRGKAGMGLDDAIVGYNHGKIDKSLAFISWAFCGILHFAAMGIPVHSRWGPPLEQYAHRYDEAFVNGPEILDYGTTSTALQCMKTISIISKEQDDTKFDLLAGAITLEMLRSVLLLSLSADGIQSLREPALVRGCIRLMKLVKVHDVISPFSYEYGYLCFSVARMALGICLVEKFGEQHLEGFMKCVWTEYPTKDNPSILTEYLVQIVLNETSTWSPRESRCGWIFGWSDPPAHGGHSRLVVAESDALELMKILGDDRKMFFKALLSAYTPGALIILLLIWQRMLRNGLQRDFSGPPSRVPFLEQFLDLSWRFALAARPSDYGFVFTTGISAMFHLGKLAASPVDVEDSRAIISAYIQGIPIIEDTLLYRQTALGLYPHIPHFIIRNILLGTENLFPALIKTILARMWEMILWEGLEHIFTPPAIVASGVEDLLLFLHIHAADSSVIQIVLEER
ncbi:unnamed protein product [Rhizoctonia solani]|uniref:Uncharacterized protein n=1 Tax=Rhizoctonia solani TaxID=456999 RepID=A0A8H3CGW3_9AGAM|nr:unnamed protein product [Rhizoctonia solani]